MHRRVARGAATAASCSRSACVLAGCGTSARPCRAATTPSRATTLTVYSTCRCSGPTPPAADEHRRTARRSRSTTPAGTSGTAARVSFVLAQRRRSRERRLDRRRRPATRRTARSSDLSTRRLHRRLRLRRRPAISLPLNNENDILQISPGSPLLGFTDHSPATSPGDPAPSTRRRRARSRGWCPPTRRGARDRALHALAGRPPARPCSPTPPTRLDADDRAAGRGRAARGRDHGRRRARQHRDRRARRRRGGYAALAARGRRAPAPTRCSSAAPPTPAPRRSGSELHARAAAARSCSRRARSRAVVPDGARRRRGASTYVTSPYLEPDQYPRGGAARASPSTARASRHRRRPSTRSTATRRCGSCSRAIRRAGRPAPRTARRCERSSRTRR